MATRTRGSRRSTTRAGSQRSMAANSTRPTVTIAQNAVRASAAWVVEAPQLRGHVLLRPVAVHGLADAVEDGEAGEQPEPRRDAARARRRSPTRTAVSARNGSRAAARSEQDEQHRRQERQPPPEAEADEDRDEDGREGGAQPEQRVEDEDGAVGAIGPERRDVGVEHRHGEPEAGPRNAVASSSSG